MSNIAEGFERGTNKEFIQFLFIAKGSAGDLEKLRARALMRKFKEYLSAPRASRQVGRESKQKRLKVFRPEAVHAGFKKAWRERDYATIIAVARKIPDKILQEDPKLLMWYDQAVTRIGNE